MNACDLLVGSDFKKRFEKIFVNGVHYTDGAPGTKPPTAYRWEFKCSRCAKLWSVLTGSARWQGATPDCECGSTGFATGIPVVAHRG